MRESREVVWKAIYTIMPDIKEVNEPRQHIWNLPAALELAARHCFMYRIRESDDTRLVRKALEELLRLGWIKHGEDEFGADEAHHGLTGE